MDSLIWNIPTNVHNTAKITDFHNSETHERKEKQKQKQPVPQNECASNVLVIVVCVGSDSPHGWQRKSKGDAEDKGSKNKKIGEAKVFWGFNFVLILGFNKLFF